MAEKYLDGRPLIAPAYQRHLFRYASLLFAVNVPARLVSWVHVSLTVTLLVVALFVAIDLVRNLVRLGRKRLKKQ